MPVGWRVADAADDMEGEILNLTVEMLALCRGIDIAVCMGAGLNVLASLLNYAPTPEIRDGLVQHMRMITDGIATNPESATKH